MGSEKMGLLLVFFLYLYMFAASSPLDHKAFPSDSSEEIDLVEKHKPEHAHGSRNANGDHHGKSGILESRKYGHDAGFGGAHAGTGSSEHGNNGGSGSTYVPGGAGVIPIYAGGAASNHHPNRHHSTGSRNQNSIGFLTLILSAFACFIHLYSG